MCDKPQLGIATTKQLIDELAARAAVSERIGELWPSYATWLPKATVDNGKKSFPALVVNGGSSEVASDNSLGASSKDTEP